VPLRAKVLEALAQHPRRIDSPLVFPSRRKEAGHQHLTTWRNRHWTPALKAAGIEHRGPYACRHTFASWAIAAGMSLFHLSRIMGTSVVQLDRTYGHLVPESESFLRGLLDAYDAGTGGAGPAEVSV
jgi:integrase